MIDLKNSELNQGTIRLIIGLLSYVYISSGISSGYFPGEMQTLKNFAILYFSYSLIILLSLIVIPQSTVRRYIALGLTFPAQLFLLF